MSLPLSEILLAITISIACSIAARFAFCSLAPFPITHSPGRPYVTPSTTSPAYGFGMVAAGWFMALPINISDLLVVPSP